MRELQEGEHSPAGAWGLPPGVPAIVVDSEDQLECARCAPLPMAAGASGGAAAVPLRRRCRHPA